VAYSNKTLFSAHLKYVTAVVLRSKTWSFKNVP